jgi:CcmD family protein
MTTTSLQGSRRGGSGSGVRRLGATILIGAIVAAIAMWGAPAVAALQPAQPPLDEFLPIDELPEEDRLPAAPFLIAAYSIVWILAFGYFWSLTRRFAVVERDLAGLTRRVGDGDDPERS